jgi:GcrA cell cycle regulator
LAGRATTSRSRTPRPRNRVSHLPLRPTRVQYRTNGNAALKPVFVPVEQPVVALAVVPTVVIQEQVAPGALCIDLLDLREHMCRWPIGDPQDDSFHFCGRHKASGISYCDHHARQAFQPVTRRKK